MRPCVKLNNIRVIKNKKQILRIDHLTIPERDFVGIIGTNGAGKTTLLKICLGLESPRSGSVTLFGKKLNSLNQWKKTNLRKKVGYIPQSTEYNQDLPLTLREIVAMGITSTKPLFKKFTSEDQSLIDFWIHTLGLEDQKHQLFTTLSGGERQKTLIARAMCQQPKMIIFDEPCANLDISFKYRITDIIQQLYEQTKITIMFVSHETSLLPPACRRILLLNKGFILSEGTPDEILNSQQMQKAYNCSIRCENIDGRFYTLNN